MTDAYEPYRPAEVFTKEADMSDFLGLNPVPGYKPPAMKQIGLPPRVPAADELYSVQNNILRSLQALDALMDDNPDMHWEGLRHHMRNSYKTLNRWLNDHA